MMQAVYDNIYSMKNPEITICSIPAFTDISRDLPKEGMLAQTASHFTYLKINDDYIARLYPFIASPTIKQPDYFGADGVGAHITVAYVDEHLRLAKETLGKKHRFCLHELIRAKTNEKYYYAISVSSPSLLALREHYHLPALLNFKGYGIGFHITIGHELI